MKLLLRIVLLLLLALYAAAWVRGSRGAGGAVGNHHSAVVVAILLPSRTFKGAAARGPDRCRLGLALAGLGCTAVPAAASFIGYCRD